MQLLRWSYAGVNFSLDGVGGAECYNFLSARQRCLETVLFLSLAAWQLGTAARSLRLPPVPIAASRASAQCSLRLVAVLHSLVFGAEIGFKLSTGTCIWLLNPCHVITALQIAVLVLPPSRLAAGLFRLTLHQLNGPLLALLLPVVNTRLLACEVAVYYLQHALILLLPLFVLRQGIYTPEPLLDFTWVSASLAMQIIYNFTVLQLVAGLTQVNLDNILCPAISDPFRGQHYRLWALFHQSLLVSVLGKVLTCIYLRLRPPAAKLWRNGQARPE